MELRKQRDFGDLISDTFTFIKVTWKPLLQATIYICGFFIVAGMVFTCLNQLKMVEIMKDPTNVPGPFGSLRIFGVSYFLALLFTMLEHTVIALTVLCFVALYQQKGRVAPTVEEVWSWFKFYFWRFIGTMVLLVLLQMVGFVLCLLPGIYLAPITSLILVVIVVENGTLGYAFSRGFQLIKDQWWTTFGALFVIGLVVYAAALVVSIPAMLVTMGGVFLGSTKAVSGPMLMTVSVVQHLCMVFWVLPWIVICITYYSIVEVKEGTGLADRIQTLGNQKDPEPPAAEEY